MAGKVSCQVLSLERTKLKELRKQQTGRGFAVLMHQYIACKCITKFRILKCWLPPDIESFQQSQQ